MRDSPNTATVTANITIGSMSNLRATYSRTCIGPRYRRTVFPSRAPAGSRLVVEHPPRHDPLGVVDEVLHPALVDLHVLLVGGPDPHRIVVNHLERLPVQGFALGDVSGRRRAVEHIREFVSVRVAVAVA